MTESSEGSPLNIWQLKRPRDLVDRIGKGDVVPDGARIKIGDLTLDISRGATMIPSEETYRHAQTLAKGLSKITEKEGTDFPLRVVDVGTGSGLIAITLAKELGGEIEEGKIDLTATDISQLALEDAERNAASNHAHGITFEQRDGLTGFRGIDVIVSNPPFMRSSILDTKHATATTFIPPQAVVAGETGMEFYKKLLSEAPGALSPRGIIVVQHQDFDQANVEAILRGALDPSAAINPLMGRRQTAMVAGNKTWADIISSVE